MLKAKKLVNISLYILSSTINGIGGMRLNFEKTLAVRCPGFLPIYSIYFQVIFKFNPKV